MISMRLRKALAGLMAATMLFAFSPGTAFAQKYWFFQVVNEDEQPFTEEGAVRCRVYSPNASQAAILHRTSALTSAYTHALSNDSRGIIHFYSSTYGDTDVLNVKCFTQYGDYAYKNRMPRSQHKIRIDTSGVAKISQFEYFGGRLGQTATGIVLPQGALIQGIVVDRVGAGTTAASYHLSVGFEGNHAVGGRDSLVSTLEVGIGYTGLLSIHGGGTIATTGAVDSTISTVVGASHIGFALRHVVGNLSGVKTVAVRPYLVHVAGGLSVQYVTKSEGLVLDEAIGGHVYILWRMLHMGINRQSSF